MEPESGWPRLYAEVHAGTAGVFGGLQQLVPFGGARVIRGHAGLADGPLDAEGAREAALALARERGYRGA